jgi:DNA topoisomerase-6 subunit B
MDTPTFNRIRGHGNGRASSSAPADDDDADMEDGEEEEEEEEDDDDEDYDGGRKKKKAKKAVKPAAKGGKSGGKKGGPSDDTMCYYKITCRDNGCGMPHERIPDFLGRVLAGSKYGVRQTRGKFGLGAKMALIWSKKSTGLPIEVKTAHTLARGNAGSGAAVAAAASAASATTDGASSASSSVVPAMPTATGGVKPAAKVSYCKLDIDIYKNEPHVIEHTQSDNTEGWIGTQISVTISGAWSAYRSRVLQYFQQLAVITPYAQFSLKYTNESDGAKGKGNFSAVWKRRSTQIPRPPFEVKHHPSSVNDLLVSGLIDIAKEKASTSTLLPFLMTQFSCVDKGKAMSVIDALGNSFSSDMKIEQLTPKQVHEITRQLAVHKFAPPSGDCLSPAGEYNLRLGIMKELRPDLVATHSGAVSVFEGHPFIIEAGIALGGVGTEGLTVHRFANRIPLLFEGGADVATRTATTRIPWSNYKIDANKDKVGVFVSLVSTKIPFKGTGKEYIGDDITEIQEAVKDALQHCCLQLRAKLVLSSAARARANRKKNLTRYIPDVVRAIMASFKSMSSRRKEQAEAAEAAEDADGVAVIDGDDDGALASSASQQPLSGNKRGRDGQLLHRQRITGLLKDADSGKINDQTLSTQLMTAVEKADLDAALEHAASISTGLVGGDLGADGGGGGGQAIFIGPTGVSAYRDSREIHHPACVIKFLPAAMAPLADGR